MTLFDYKQLEMRGLIRNPLRVLDLGCGDWKFSRPFYEHGSEVTLVDLNVSRVPGADGPRRIIIQGDIASFVPQGVYDVIFARHVLMFLPSKETVKAVIACMYQALAINGVMVFTLFGIRDEWAGDPDMVFFTRQECLDVLPKKPYSLTEKEGALPTLEGGKKHGHVFEIGIVKSE